MKVPPSLQWCEQDLLARHPSSTDTPHLQLALDLLHAPGREHALLRCHDALLIHDVVPAGVLQVRPRRVGPDGIGQAEEGERDLFTRGPRVRAPMSEAPATGGPSDSSIAFPKGAAMPALHGYHSTAHACRRAHAGPPMPHKRCGCIDPGSYPCPGGSRKQPMCKQRTQQRNTHCIRHSAHRQPLVAPVRRPAQRSPPTSLARYAPASVITAASSGSLSLAWSIHFLSPSWNFRSRWSFLAGCPAAHRHTHTHTHPGDMSAERLLVVGALVMHKWQDAMRTKLAAWLGLHPCCNWAWKGKLQWVEITLLTSAIQFRCVPTRGAATRLPRGGAGT